jgi:hypothetical protein
MTTNSRSDWDMWNDIPTLVAWLNSHNEVTDHELTLRIAKIGEEFGEAMAARIGMIGQNPRKGVTHTGADLAGELCDVIVTAAVALTSLYGDAAIARGMLASKVSMLLARADANQAEARAS